MKICFITGTRAEYGLMRWIIQGFHDDPEIIVQIIVTGMHLSPEFGLTFKEIEKDGFTIDKKIEILLSSDTPVGISKSTGLGLISISEGISELNPDLIVLLGDRFESLASATAAMIARIPIAHIHGGESTEGLIDEPIRHAISKMSHLHFTSTEVYRKRVIQMGENPSKVYNSGAPGLDNIYKLKLKNKKELFDKFSLETNDKYFLITFHPVTLEKDTAEIYIDELLNALGEFPDYKLIFTMPNADTDGRIIYQKIQKYFSDYPSKGGLFKSLGQLNYLSALKYSSLVIGNSSSGLIEAPSFKVPTINIGNRQKRRIKAESVINCDTNKASIVNSINVALSNDFLRKTKSVVNPYGNGGASEKICDIIKSVDLEGIIFKEFYQL